MPRPRSLLRIKVDESKVTASGSRSHDPDCKKCFIYLGSPNLLEQYKRRSSELWPSLKLEYANVLYVYLILLDITKPFLNPLYLTIGIESIFAHQFFKTVH